MSWRTVVRNLAGGVGDGKSLRQAPVGQPPQTQSQAPQRAGACGKKQEKQVSGSWQRDRPGQKPGGGEGLGDGQGGQRRLAQGTLLLCGLGAGPMGAAGRLRGRVSAQRDR